MAFLRKIKLPVLLQLRVSNYTYRKGIFFFNACSCCPIESHRVISFVLRGGTIRSWTRSFYLSDRFRTADERLKCIANIKRRKGKGGWARDNEVYMHLSYSRSSPTIFDYYWFGVGADARQTLKESISVGTILQIGNRRISPMLFARANH